MPIDCVEKRTDQTFQIDTARLSLFCCWQTYVFYVCKSFAFVAGLVSIQYIIIKHFLACARDELCTVGELIFFRNSSNVCQFHL